MNKLFSLNTALCLKIARLIMCILTLVKIGRVALPIILLVTAIILFVYSYSYNLKAIELEEGQNKLRKEIEINNGTTESTVDKDDRGSDITWNRHTGLYCGFAGIISVILAGVAYKKANKYISKNELVEEIVEQEMQELAVEREPQQARHRHPEHEPQPLEDVS